MLVKAIVELEGIKFFEKMIFSKGKSNSNPGDAAAAEVQTIFALCYVVHVLYRPSNTLENGKIVFRSIFELTNIKILELLQMIYSDCMKGMHSTTQLCMHIYD